MKNHLVLAVLLVLILGAVTAPCRGAVTDPQLDAAIETDFRDYHSAKGDVIKARLIELNGKTAVIEKQGSTDNFGKLIHYSVALDTFSADDQAHIQDLGLQAAKAREIEKQKVLIVGKVISVAPDGIILDSVVDTDNPPTGMDGYDRWVLVSNLQNYVYTGGQMIDPSKVFQCSLIFTKEAYKVLNGPVTASPDGHRPADAIQRLAQAIKTTTDLNRLIDVNSMYRGRLPELEDAIAPRKTGLFFIAGKFDGVVDDQIYGGIFYPCGTMQYGSADNARRTVARYADTPQLAMQLSPAAKP